MAALSLLHAIVDAAMQAGARLAEPGEFTFRAYLHGRMDLVQAEAVRISSTRSRRSRRGPPSISSRER